MSTSTKLSVGDRHNFFVKKDNCAVIVNNWRVKQSYLVIWFCSLVMGSWALHVPNVLHESTSILKIEQHQLLALARQLCVAFLVVTSKSKRYYVYATTEFMCTKKFDASAQTTKHHLQR